MKVFKRVFKKRFTNKQERGIQEQGIPNRSYLVGVWKYEKVRIEARIVSTNGHRKWTKEMDNKKGKVEIQNATYVIYELNVYQKGQRYHRYYYYTK